MSGIEKISLRVPEQWDPKWFRDFVRDVLAKADVRNATGELGIRVSGDPTKPAVIAFEGSDNGVFDAVRAFLGDRDAPRDVRAGAGVTVTRDAAGYVVSAPADDVQRILAARIFG